jgi:sentrin-specific protease 7
MTFDSLGLARPKACTALREYLVEEAKNKKGWNIDKSLIQVVTATGIPTQLNSSDCGLYICAYLECFTLNLADFVRRILRQQMNASRDMPIMASEMLRSSMRGLIISLHNKQES